MTSGDDIQETGGHINDADCLKALQAASELLRKFWKIALLPRDPVIFQIRVFQGFSRI